MKGFEGSSSINLSDNLDGSEASLVSNEDVEENLEEKWTDVIDGPEDMTRSQKNQQEAIWELLSTEYKYVGKIRVILQVSITFSNLLTFSGIWVLKVRISIRHSSAILRCTCVELFSFCLVSMDIFNNYILLAAIESF